jgi:hypothetical protein
MEAPKKVSAHGGFRTNANRTKSESSTGPSEEIGKIILHLFVFATMVKFKRTTDETSIYRKSEGKN